MMRFYQLPCRRVFETTICFKHMQVNCTFHFPRNWIETHPESQKTIKPEIEGEASCGVYDSVWNLNVFNAWSLCGKKKKNKKINK